MFVLLFTAQMLSDSFGCLASHLAAAVCYIITTRRRRRLPLLEDLDVYSRFVRPPYTHSPLTRLKATAGMFLL